MSTAPVTPTAAPAPVKKSAIELIEEDIVSYLRQKEQAIFNLHLVEGAIQGARSLITRLKAEAAKAEVESKKIGAEVEHVAETVVTDAKNEASALINDIKKL